MAVDIDKIRKRLAEINSGGGNSGGNKFKRFKYDAPGEYKIRVLPFAGVDPGDPFPTRLVYYGISATGGGMIVSPENNGGVDPIKNFRIGLYNEAKNQDPAQAEETKKMASLLKEKTATCVAVIDRANEADGPVMWNPNWTDAQQLLSLFLTDAGDFTDLTNGCDLTLIVSNGKKINQKTKKPLLEAKIVPARANSPAHKDPTVIETWMAAMPIVNDYFPVASTEATQQKLQEWLDSGANVASSDGTARGGASAKSEAEPEPTKPTEVKPAERKPTPKPPTVKKPLLAEVEDGMDDALDDLENGT